MKHSRRRGLHSIAVFLDIEKAFDRVQLTFVVDRLLELGVEGRALHFLRGYLSGRHFAVKIGNS